MATNDLDIILLKCHLQRLHLMSVAPIQELQLADGSTTSQFILRGNQALQKSDFKDQEIATNDLELIVLIIGPIKTQNLRV